MEYIAERITIDPDLCNGKPTIRETRMTVNNIVGYIIAGETREEILYQFPSLENEDIDACLKFVESNTENKKY